MATETSRPTESQNRPLKVLTVFRAQDIRDGSEVPNMILTTERAVPDGAGPAAQAFDARCIAEMLCQSLPGATVDALLRELLMRKASELVVPGFGS